MLHESDDIIRRAVNEYCKKTMPVDFAITFVSGNREKKMLTSLDVPVINVSMAEAPDACGKILSVAADHVAAGKLAASHFAERGVRHALYLGNRLLHHSNLKEKAFSEGCAQHRISCQSFDLRSPAHEDFADLPGKRSLLAQLSTLPRPLGIDCNTDTMAEQLPMLAHRNGIRCPSDWLILGTDMDIACRLLRESDLTMAEVADRAGFSSGERFASVFRAQQGVTPRQFRLQRGGPGGIH